MPGLSEDGRWPGQYDKFGYQAIKEPGRRGCQIVLGDPDEVQMIKDIFDWYDGGTMVRNIRMLLIKRAARQKQTDKVRHDWNPAILSRILRDRDYTGRATWRFADGMEYTIDIPPIVAPELWERVQRKIDANQKRAARKARGVYLCQGLCVCGDCGRRLNVYLLRYRYSRMADGTKQRH